MVDRVHANDLSVEKFMEEYWSIGKPVIIEGAVDSWPALTKWNLNDLQQRLSGRTVSCRQTHHPDYRNGSRYTTQTMKFEQYIKTLTDSKALISQSGEKKSYYLAVQNIKEVFPELQDEYAKPIYCPKVHRGPFLWIAPSSHFEYTHFDPDDNFLVIVKGRKHIKLFSPEDGEKLYPHPLGSMGTTIQSQIDLSEDSFENFPKFDLNLMKECDITDGDMLFIPYGYWHQVTSPEIVISVNFFCGDENAENFLSKLFSDRLFPTFSYWVLNLIEQNRQHGNKPMVNVERYSDEQLAHCLNQFFVSRYHCPLTEEQISKLIVLTREYCTEQDKKENISPVETKAQKPPRIKIRGLKWRIPGITMKENGYDKAKVIIEKTNKK